MKIDYRNNNVNGILFTLVTKLLLIIKMCLNIFKKHENRRTFLNITKIRVYLLGNVNELLATMTGIIYLTGWQIWLICRISTLIELKGEGDWNLSLSVSSNIFQDLHQDAPEFFFFSFTSRCFQRFTAHNIRKRSNTLCGFFDSRTRGPVRPLILRHYNSIHY